MTAAPVATDSTADQAAVNSRDVAIVGIAARVPGARDVAALWDLLLDGRIGYGPQHGRWETEAYLDPSGKDSNKAYTDVLGQVDDIDLFDPLAFGMSPRRAQVLDPQQRLLLMAARAAVEDAGGVPTRTGVFVGISTSDYRNLLSARSRALEMTLGVHGARPEPAVAEQLLATVDRVPPARPFSMPGVLLNMAAAVVNQHFDLSGPSYAVDAACASSLVALNEAVLNLRAGTCEAAIVGGVHLNLSADALVGFSRIGAVSKAGTCAPFQANADGFVLGEGVGAVVLKPLAAALAAGDPVHAVIKGVSCGNDGKAPGPMTPRMEGQLGVLRDAYADARVDPASVTFVEAHGTATDVGDKIEVAALQALQGDSDGALPCHLSSVKANLGHAMSAAGVLGLIKAVLVLRHGVVPPQPHDDAPSTEIGLEDSRFRVIRSPEALLPAPGGAPALAGVSSFGFGGTNVHVVLEAAPVAAPAADGPAVLTLSGADRGLVAQQARELAEAFRGNLSGAAVRDVAAVLSRRPRGAATLAVVAASPAQAAALLTSCADRLDGTDELPTRIAPGAYFRPAPLGEDPAVVFLFPGQGSQEVGGLASLVGEPAAAQRIPELTARAASSGAEEVHALLTVAATSQPADAAARLTQTEVCQPALLVQGVLLSELLGSAGVRPDVALGHSLGEFAAASAVGRISGDDAVRLGAVRGAAMAALALDDPGAMLALRTDAAAAQELLAGIDGVWIANDNGPTQVVASGRTASVAELERRAEAAGITARRLVVSHAFHTPVLEGCAGPVRSLLSELPLPDATAGRLVSCVAPADDLVGADELRAVWGAHAHAPVRFREGLAAVIGAVEADRPVVVVQVGGGDWMLNLASAALGPERTKALVGLDDFRAGLPGAEGVHGLWGALAHLTALGVPVELAALTGLASAVVDVPARPLALRRMWLDAGMTGSPAPAAETSAPAPAPVPVAAPPVSAAPAPAASPGTPSAATPPIVPAPLINAAGKENAMDGLLALFQQQNALLGAALGLTPAPAATTQPAPQVVPVSAPIAAAPVATPAPAPAPRSGGPSRSTALLTDIATVSAFDVSDLSSGQTLVGDLGFDSLMITDLLRRTEARFGELGDVVSLLHPEITVGEIVTILDGAGSEAAAATVPAAVLDLRDNVPAGWRGADGQPVLGAETPSDVTLLGGEFTEDSATPVVVGPDVDDVSLFPEYLALREQLKLSEILGVANPFFSLHEKVVRDTSIVDGREVVSFSTYNYLGLSGDPAVNAGVVEAVERYGTSVSASRMLCGERPVHLDLERELAGLLGTEDAIVMVSGHATNVTTIGHMVGPGDLIVHDALAHNSIMQGCELSGATRRPFPHNDYAALDALLQKVRGRYRRVLIAVEGVYSMDGDIPDLPTLIEIKKRHRALLMVDEAHSIGVLGPHGGGIGDHFDVDRRDVDLWIGTMSKSLSSCGGFVGGRKELIEYLKYTAPGFIYSVGMTPANTAAALASIRQMKARPELLDRLRSNSMRFLNAAKAAGLNTGPASGTPVVPIITGDSLLAVRLSEALLERGVIVNPIMYPAVAEEEARLRFFVTACHSEQQIDDTVALIRSELDRLTARFADEAPLALPARA